MWYILKLQTIIEFLEICTFCLISFSSNELAYWSFIFLKYSGHDVSTISQSTRMLCLRIVYGLVFSKVVFRQRSSSIKGRLSYQENTGIAIVKLHSVAHRDGLIGVWLISGTVHCINLHSLAALRIGTAYHVMGDKLKISSFNRVIVKLHSIRPTRVDEAWHPYTRQLC